MRVLAVSVMSLLMVTSGMAAMPKWDGKESVAAYAQRAGIAETELRLDLGNGVTLPFVLVPAGTFVMGGKKDSEKPAHEVTITKPFYMTRCTVTKAQVAQLAGKDLAAIKDANYPATETWFAATNWCAKVGEKAGRIGRLPTEAEWEYACRAGSTNSYFFGEDDKAFTRMADYAWFGTNGVHVYEVGQKKPNAWGFHDMYGNVFQWVWDYYGTYTPGALIDPQGPAEDKCRVLRGSSYDRLPSKSGTRTRHPPSATKKDGFRVVLELK